MDRKLYSKFKIKPGSLILVINSPEGFICESSNADEKPMTGTYYDFLLVFATDRSEIDSLAPTAVEFLKKDSPFWIAYPKKTSRIKTNITRDYGWKALTDRGLKPVSLISIDETWSALRFRPVKKSTAKRPEAKSVSKKSFSAIIEKPNDGMDTAYISIPFSVEKAYGTKGQVKVNATFNGYPYRGVLANMGTGCHVIILRKDIRLAIGKNVGDKINVTLEQDLEERKVEIPVDLKKALSNQPRARKFFNDLSFTNRKEYAVWITSAKKTETRTKRLASTIQKLLQEKKNPSQK